MAALKYQVPEEYSKELRYVEPSDTRLDIELLESLETHIPVAGEKNVWAFWDSGFSKAPAWCQRNVTIWIRMNSSRGWTVRIMDSVEGSANHWSRFIPNDMVAPALAQGKMDGP